MTYQVLPLDISDFDAIYEIEKKAYDISWDDIVLRSVFNMQGDHVKLMLNNEVIVGYAFVSIVLDEAHLLNIAIDPQYRGQGLGRYLLTNILEKIKKKNIALIFLEVRQSNIVAYNLYESLGFNQIGERKNYYPVENNTREDALVMAYMLQPTMEGIL